MYCRLSGSPSESEPVGDAAAKKPMQYYAAIPTEVEFRSKEAVVPLCSALAKILHPVWGIAFQGGH